MALIGKIRQNGWILVVALGLALFAFIIQEYVQNRSNYNAGDLNSMGRVDGVSIDRARFDAYQKNVYGNAQADPYQVTAQVYNHFVDEALAKGVAEKVGLGVPKDELLDLQFGTTNLSPIIMQRFQGEGGGVNMAQLQQIKQAIDSKQLPAQYREYWGIQEDEIIADRLQAKYTNMVAKGLYTPKWQAEMAFSENNQRSNFTYVRVPFDKVPVTEVKPTDADYASFLEQNKEQFWQDEESRTVDFAAIDVIPSAQDSASALDGVNKALAGWASASNDSAYVVDQKGVWNNGFLTKDQIPASLQGVIAGANPGSIVGPVLADGAYTIAKVLARKAVPDSVKARHILIKPDAAGIDGAEKVVDSLLTVLKTGRSSFDSLAARFGTDGTRDKGGDLGWFGPGAMVKEFNEMAFFKLDQGVATKVRTQFGWHVIEVTGKKFTTNQSGTQLAMVSRIVEPSDNTESSFRQKAEELAVNCKTLEQLKEAAKKMGIELTAGQAAKRNDASVGIASGTESRQILRWAYNEDTKLGSVSKTVFTLPNQTPGSYSDGKYLVAALKSIRPKGYARVDDVKEQIQTQVMTRKRGEMLLAQVKDASSLSGLATQFGVTVDTATMASFASPSLGAGGFEPRVVGQAFGTPEGQLTKPFVGNSGVFLVNGVKTANQVVPPGDLSMFKRQFVQGVAGQVRQRLFTSMRKDADIQDFRSNFN
jgi:peptidyl-prolyl cis-trans isomerase D